MENRLEERISKVHKLTNTQLDMMNQLMLANQELNRKDVEIAHLISQKELLKNELKTKNEYVERFKNLNKEMKYFE